MSVHSFLDAGLPCEPREEMSQIALVDRVTSEGAEEGCRSGRSESGSDVQPPLYEGGCAWIETDDASFVAFAVLNYHGSLFDLEVFGLEGEGFADP